MNTDHNNARDISTIACETISTIDLALQREIARVRDELIPAYMSIPGTVFAVLIMRSALESARQAIVSGNTVGMIAAYQELKGLKL